MRRAEVEILERERERKDPVFVFALRGSRGRHCLGGEDRLQRRSEVDEFVVVLSERGLLSLCSVRVPVLVIVKRATRAGSGRVSGETRS